MSARDAAVLTAGLLAAKGEAIPLRVSSRAPRTAAPNPRARVSVRLDEAQHLRLRLAAAHERKTVHAVLLEAIEQYLDRIVPGSVDPSCACLARHGAPESIAIVPFRTP